jgi:hypothetical protein
MSDPVIRNPDIQIGALRYPMPPLPPKPASTSALQLHGHTVLQNQTPADHVPANIVAETQQPASAPPKPLKEEHQVKPCTSQVNQANSAKPSEKSEKIDRDTKTISSLLMKVMVKIARICTLLIKPVRTSSENSVQQSRSPPISVTSAATKPQSPRAAKLALLDKLRNDPDAKLDFILKDPQLYLIFKGIKDNQGIELPHQKTICAATKFQKYPTIQNLTELRDQAEQVGFTRSGSNSRGFYALDKIKNFLAEPRGDVSSEEKKKEMKDAAKIILEMANDDFDATGHLDKVENFLKSDQPEPKYISNDLEFKAVMEDPHLFEIVMNKVSSQFLSEISFLPQLYAISKALNENDKDKRPTNDEMLDFRQQLQKIHKDHLQPQNEEDVYLGSQSMSQKLYANITSELMESAPQAAATLNNNNATDAELTVAVNSLIKERTHIYRQVPLNFIRKYA